MLQKSKQSKHFLLKPAFSVQYEAEVYTFVMFYMLERKLKVLRFPRLVCSRVKDRLNPWHQPGPPVCSQETAGKQVVIVPNLHLLMNEKRSFRKQFPTSLTLSL